METGTLVSGLGHAGLILWVILGDFLFNAQDVPPVAVTSVSLMSTAEFEEMAAVASSPTPAPEVTPEPQPEPEPTPEPTPEPEPEVQPPPPLEPALDPPPETEPLPEAEPQPEEVPEPVAPVAEVEQPLASDAPTIRPKPRPADRVAPDPAPTPEPEAVTDPEPTPAVSETPTETPVVEEDPTTEAVAEEAGDILRTEATEDQDEALGMTTSPRPRSRPAAAPAEETTAETETAAEASDPEADAIAAALAEATASDATEQSERPAGPPMSRGEQDALRVAVAACWSVGSVSSEAMRTTVTVRVDMEPNGRPVPSSIRMTGFEGGSDASAKIMFDAARRAIIRCTKDGYPLPSEKYETWRDLELVFDPTGMVLR